jgi:tripeptidyl-peptidase-1
MPLRAPTDGERRRRGERDDKRSLDLSLAHPLALYSPQPPAGGEDLDSCNITMTPTCLRTLYSFPPAKRAAKSNSYGIAEFSPASYLGSDLDLYFSEYSPKLVGQRPIEVGIDGGAEQNATYGFNFQGRINLNLQIAMTLVAPQKVTLLQAGDDIVGASFNTVLDALDASYCTYEGGEDPTLDPTYPDQQPGGYDGPKSCGILKPPGVLTTPVTLSEAQLTPLYEERQCHEYAKLGLMGTTVLYSASDYGVLSPSRHS